MAIPFSRACRMEVTFQSPPDERPEMYDFFWQHAPALYPHLNQKTVRVRLALPPLGTKNEKGKICRAFIQKMGRDNRFTLSNTRFQTDSTLGLEATLPANELDALLNTYNVLFEAGLSHTQLESPELAIDFSRVSENGFHIETTEKNATPIRSFIHAHAHFVPKIQTISFTLTHPFQNAPSLRSQRGK